MYSEKEIYDLPDHYCSMKPEEKAECLKGITFPLRFHGLNHDTSMELFDYLERYCAGRKAKEQEDELVKQWGN